MQILHLRVHQSSKDLVNVYRQNPPWVQYISWERDTKESLLHLSSIQQWFRFDYLACLATPCNKVNLLDYLHFFTSLSVLLHISCQGLQQWSGIHFSCFALRVGQVIPFVQPHFLQSGGSSIQPSIHRFMDTGTSYVFIFIRLSFSFHQTPNCSFLCTISK